MMFGTRSVAAAVGLVAALAAAMATTQDAPAVPMTAVTTQHVSLEQPLSVTDQPGPFSVTSTPSTTPPAKHVYSCHPGHADCAALPGCPSGYVCAYVFEGGVEWEFQFFDYGAYHLSNWFNPGFLANHQTGGAAARTFHQAGDQVHCYPPRSTEYDVTSWDPVWRIDLTASPC